jgi:DNA-directed RNA polymerase subunit RPC12/RpoP
LAECLQALQPTLSNLLNILDGRSSPVEEPSSSDEVKGLRKSHSHEEKVAGKNIKVESSDDKIEDPDFRPRSTSPPQRIAGRKRPHSVDSPLFSRRWGRDALLRVKPDPLAVMCKAFPGHARDVLERILQGCGGNVVQAIECILENEGPPPLHAPIPIMPNPSLPPVIYPGYTPHGGMLRNTDSLSSGQMAMYRNYPPASRAKSSSQGLISHPHAPVNKDSSDEKQMTENGSKYEKKIYCTNCGHKFQENDNFCGNCGHKIL